MAQVNGRSSATAPPPVVASPMAPDSQPSDDDDSDRQSLTESVTDYPVEWGRTYHRYREGLYLFPNDSEERDRMNLQHDCMKRIHDGKLFFAPLKNPDKILDLGTGTGIWPIQVADTFPWAKIIGTDLSAIQPAEVPPNVFFEISDCTDEDWGLKTCSFDLIHTGTMLGSLPCFENLLRTSKRYLKPGAGWLECHEIDIGPYCDDGTMPPDYPLTQYSKFVVEAAKRVVPPRPMDTALSIATWMRQAGFVDVHERIDKMPYNPWPRDPFLKQLGRDWERHVLLGLAGWAYKLFGERGLGWTREKVEVFLIDVRRSLKNRYIHSYCNVHVVYGRRPGEVEESQMRRMPAPLIGSGREDRARCPGRC